MSFRQIAVLALLAATLHAQGDWPSPGRDPGGMKFSPLTQITPANVAKLAAAWTYDTGDVSGGFRPWEITPLVVNGVMYISTTSGKIVALNPDTGAELWKFDSKTAAAVVLIPPAEP